MIAGRAFRACRLERGEAAPLVGIKSRVAGQRPVAPSSPSQPTAATLALQLAGPVVGTTAQTRREPLDNEHELKDLVLPKVALSFMSASMNQGLTQYPLNLRVPGIANQITGSRGRFKSVLQKARDEGWTVPQRGMCYAQSLGFPPGGHCQQGD